MRGEVSVSALLFVATLTACGDKGALHCAPGTKLDPSGKMCVPDGSVICGNGTTYETVSGTCVAGGCPSGQVLVNGTCTADVTPDAEEDQEPNDFFGAGEIPLPDVDAPGYVVHGCITPVDESIADHDPWFISVARPTLLDVTAAGVGGLAAGFEVRPTAEITALVNNNWVRYGANLVDFTSHRKVFLPAAGKYTISFADSRQLSAEDTPTGSEQSCYFGTVSQLALPTPTALNAGAKATGTLGSDVQPQFFSVPVTEGELFFTSLSFEGNGSSAYAAPALVQQMSGQYVQSADGGLLFDRNVNLTYDGTKASDQLVYVVDSNINLSLEPVHFTLDLSESIEVPALPTGGQPVTILSPRVTGNVDNYGEVSYFWFDVEAGDFVHLKLDFSHDANFMIVLPGLGNIGYTGTVNQIAGNPGDTHALAYGPQTAHFQGWYRFPVGGRYYLTFYDPDGETTQMTSTLVKATSAPIAIGTPISRALGATNGEWLTLDPTAQRGIDTTASGVNISGKVQVDYYPVDFLSPSDGVRHPSGGLAGADFPFLPTFQQAFTASGETHSRMTFGDPTKYFVRVSQSNPAPVAQGADFTFSIDAQTFIDLGSVDATRPADKPGEDLGGSGQTKLYFVHGNAGNTVTITIHPTADLTTTVNWFDLDEHPRRSASAAVGADVTLAASMGARKYVAFAVTGSATTGTKYDVHVAAASSPSYTMAAGRLAYQDICNGANRLPLSDDHDGLSAEQTIPFNFSLFGDPVMRYRVSSNGWLSFETVTDSAPLNQPLPTEGAPDALVAPNWTDLKAVVVCKAESENQITVQWTGLSAYFPDPPHVQVQAVLHRDGSVDFIWGNSHDDPGFLTTVGLENVFGTFGKMFEYTTTQGPGHVLAGTSVKFIPMP